MRVSLFGLFLRCTSLKELWPETIQSDLLVLDFIRFYCYTYTYHHSPPGIVSPLAWGVLSDSPGFSCPGHGAWSVWILPVADLRGAAEALISSYSFRTLFFQAPCMPPEFSFSKLVSAFLLFTPVHPLYSRNCAILVM